MILHAVVFPTAGFGANMDSSSALSTRGCICTSRRQIKWPANATAVCRFEAFAYKVLWDVRASSSFGFGFALPFSLAGRWTLRPWCALRRWLGILMLSFIQVVWVGLSSWRHLVRVRFQLQQMKTDTGSDKGFGQLNIKWQISIGSAFQTCDHLCQMEKYGSVCSKDLHHGGVGIPRWGIFLKVAQEFCMVCIHRLIRQQAYQVEG